MNNTSSNPSVQEIGLIIISSLAIVGAVVLFFTGKIDYAGCAGLLGGVFALWGANTLYKAPSPSQQATFQQLLSDVLQTLPTFVGAMHTHLPEPVMQAPVAPPQAQQTAAPTQSSVVPGVTLTPTPPNSSAIVAESIPPTGTFTTVQQVPAQVAQTRDAWSNSALMQAIGKPPQQQ